ncbi:Cytochrome P450 3A12 [Fusarium oxysporum f. sp. cubense]|uniref:Cytochrome P450 3A12 n=1 Tax=Fusarium oxysporum f. sp. cubense TaxID=61366 RepID=A0A559LAM8_FUSOC|nr:Cytochrome P450 3A12 [Fusarium oxysporum f. sp. cubense]
MTPLSIPTLAIALVFFVAFYERIAKPAFLSPLAKIPTPHWSCHVAPFWLWWAKLTHRENKLVYENHMAKGKALRLSPGLVSLNCFEGGLKQVYLGGFPKTEFYWRGFANYGTHNIFTFEDNATHSARKRIISGTFSKSFILADKTSQASMKKVLFGRLLPLFSRAADRNEALEVLELFYSYSMDSFVTWQFGCKLSSNLIEDEQERRLYLDGFFAAAPYTFWQYEFPTLNTLFKKIGLIPKKVDSGFHDIEQWNLEKCDKAQKLIAEGEENLDDSDKPVVMSLALKAMSDPASKPAQYPRRLEIASDMFAHNSAAHETSGNTLTYCFYELSKRPELQAKLREELLTLDPPLHFPPPAEGEWILPSPKDLDKLPLLEAVILETLRLYPSVPGGQPRRVPKPCSLGGYDGIPAGTTVQCYAWSLHRTPEIFPEPDQWKPERWIDSTPEQLSNMRRWFWAFGSGGRMCIGSNFAYFSMKNVVGSVYTNFTTEVHDHGSMALEDAYLAGPEGHRLELKLKRINS